MSVIHFGSNNPQQKYEINGVELGDTSNERDLGVVFSSDLKWKSQTLACSSKANAMLSLLGNTFVCLDMKLVRTLFTVYVRPLIEFAVPVWCPYFGGRTFFLGVIARSRAKASY